MTRTVQCGHLKICPHCVADAQCLNITDGFISWFTANWKLPNLTKLKTGLFGQNVAKKPTQSCHSQKRLNLLS